ncbi:MAG: hypothetical protein MJA31_06075 [Clostridia bacterium]|nr:hypothetical protein [Clostridia bacterium]
MFLIWIALLFLWIIFIGKLTLDTLIIGALASIILIMLNTKLKLFPFKHR